MSGRWHPWLGGGQFFGSAGSSSHPPLQPKVLLGGRQSRIHSVQSRIHLRINLNFNLDQEGGVEMSTCCSDLMAGFIQPAFSCSCKARSVSRQEISIPAVCAYLPFEIEILNEARKTDNSIAPLVICRGTNLVLHIPGAQFDLQSVVLVDAAFAE